jgi:hypothetical protein
MALHIFKGSASMKRIPSPRNRNMPTKAHAFRGLSLVKDLRIRNLLRGTISAHHGKEPSADAINAIRNAATVQDLALSSRLILGRQGAFPFSNRPDSYQSLLRQNKLNKIPVRSELAFVAGHINGWATDACQIIVAMGTLAAIPTSSAADAMEALALFAEKFGASSFVARKVAYLI